RWETTVLLSFERTAPILLGGVSCLLLMCVGGTLHATGSWSTLTLPQLPGQVTQPTSIAVDRSGNLYVAEDLPNDRVQKRDLLGNWSVLTTEGARLGQVAHPTAVTADGAGNLYVADRGAAGNVGRVQRRDPKGNWTLVATEGQRLGQFEWP